MSKDGWTLLIFEVTICRYCTYPHHSDDRCSSLYGEGGWVLFFQMSNKEEHFFQMSKLRRALLLRQARWVGHFFSEEHQRWALFFQKRNPDEHFSPDEKGRWALAFYNSIPGHFLSDEQGRWAQNYFKVKLILLLKLLELSGGRCSKLSTDE